MTPQPRPCNHAEIRNDVRFCHYYDHGTENPAPKSHTDCYEMDAIGRDKFRLACIKHDVCPYQCKKDCSFRFTKDTRSRPATPSEPKFSSTDLLLLANDEWKRREERKHNHENAPWCAGFINGFLTDKKWARGWLDKIQKDAEDKILISGVKRE